MPGHFESMVRSFHDLSLYGEVATQRSRRTVGYVAIIVALASLVAATAYTFKARALINKELIPEIDRLPVITIKDHIASVNVPQPWVRSFEDPSTHLKSILVIDTTGKVTDFKFDEQGVILTRTQLKLKNPQNPYLKPLELRDVNDITIDPPLVKGFIPTALGILFGAIAVGGVFWYTSAKLFQALLLAVVGLLFASGRRRPLGFGQLYTVSLYALTPAIALDLLLICTGVSLPWFWLIYMLLGATFTALGVRKIPDADPAMPPPPVVPSPPVQSPPGADIQS